MYRTESLAQYFPRLAFLNFIFNFILSCFFLYLKVYANEAECKQWRHERFAYILGVFAVTTLKPPETKVAPKIVYNGAFIEQMLQVSWVLFAKRALVTFC